RFQRMTVTECRIAKRLWNFSSMRRPASAGSCIEFIVPHGRTLSGHDLGHERSWTPKVHVRRYLIVTRSQPRVCSGVGLVEVVIGSGRRCIPLERLGNE